MVIGAATEVIAGEGRIVTAGRPRHPHPLHLPAAGDRGASAPASPRCSAAAPAPPPAPRPPPARPASGTSTACSRPPRRFRSTSGSSARATLRRPTRCASRSPPGPSASSCTRTGGRRRPPSTARSSVAEEYDVQVAIHTDTLNEAGFVEDSIRAFKGRTIHTYHTEGAGGGHAPDIIRVCRRAQLPAVVHQPDDAVHREHDGRAPRHADGLPPPQRRRSPRTSPSPSRASAPRRSPPRTCCTTWAPSA